MLIMQIFLLGSDYPVAKSFTKPKKGEYIYVTKEVQVYEVNLKTWTSKLIQIPRGKTVEQVLETPSKHCLRVRIHKARNMFEYLCDHPDFDCPELKGVQIFQIIVENLHAIKCIAGNFLNLVADLIEIVINAKDSNTPQASQKLALFDYRYRISSLIDLNLFDRVSLQDERNRP